MRAEYFPKQAANCLHLSRQCFDLHVAERLRLTAADFLSPKRKRSKQANSCRCRLSKLVIDADESFTDAGTPQKNRQSAQGRLPAEWELPKRPLVEMGLAASYRAAQRRARSASCFHSSRLAAFGEAFAIRSQSMACLWNVSAMLGLVMVPSRDN
jgi:hypothetical protein